MDKDHAPDEEFRGRRSSFLEQFASRPANHNSLPLDVRSTSEGSPVRLIDTAPDDYLGRALQIYSSSSSSWYENYKSRSSLARVAIRL